MPDVLVPVAVLVAGPLAALAVVVIARLTATDLRVTDRPRADAAPALLPTTRRSRPPARSEPTHG